MPSRLNFYVDEIAANLGTVEIEVEDDDHWQQDRAVVFVGIATVGGGRLGVSEKDGTKKWTHKCKVIALRAADGDMRNELIDMFALVAPGDQMHFDLGLQDAPQRRPPLPAPAAAAAAPPPPAPPVSVASSRPPEPFNGSAAQQPDPVPVPGAGPRAARPAGDFFGEVPPGDAIRAG